MTRLEVTGALDKARQEYTKFQNEVNQVNRLFAVCAYDQLLL